eukprot:c13900_g1_i2.p1 GENE.c13900_g1_i2~~c13900_g1_i2.p1  ORF type:complete len:227 (+),score=31.53 c13900_g1_i2:535-1215(+)
MNRATTSNPLVAVGMDSSNIRLCDLRAHSSAHSLIGHSASVRSVTWSSGSEYLLATGSDDCTARLWDVRRSGSFLVLKSSKHNKKSHDSGVISVHFGHNGSRIFTLCRNRVLKAWDSHVGNLDRVNFPKMPRTSKSPRTFKMATGAYAHHIFVPNGEKITMFNTWSGQIVNTLSSHLDRVTGCAFDPRFEELFSCGKDAMLFVYAPPCPGISGNSHKAMPHWDDSD